MTTPQDDAQTGGTQGYGGPPPGGPPPGYGGPPPGNGGPPPGYGQPPGGYGPPPGPRTTAYPTAPPRPLSDAEQRQWAVLAHLSGIAVSLFGPLVVLLVFKGRGRFLDEQAKEALNFQITHALIQIIGVIGATVLTVVSFGLLAFVYAVVFWIVYLWMAIFAIVAAVGVNNGQAYRYPMNIRLVR